jgi:hypothetical protein
VLAFSKAHGWSVWFTYKLARERKLRLRKAGRRTIVLPEDEAAFHASLPIFEPQSGGGAAAA